MIDKDKNHIRAIMDERVSKLREHVDNVQILCNTTDEGYSISWQSGYGNWWARVGHV